MRGALEAIIAVILSICSVIRFPTVLLTRVPIVSVICFMIGSIMEVRSASLKVFCTSEEVTGPATVSSVSSGVSMTEMPRLETSRNRSWALGRCCTVEVRFLTGSLRGKGVAKECSTRATFPGVPMVLFSGAPGRLADVLWLEGVPVWIVWLVEVVRGVLTGHGT